MNSVPFLQVLAVSIVFMAIGTVWHGPLFGSLWMKAVGFDKKPPKKEEVQKSMAMGFINEIVMSAGIAVLLGATAVTNFHDAIWVVGMAWLAFAFTSSANRTIWEKGAPSLLLISAGYALTKAVVAVFLFTEVPWFQII